MEKMLCQQMDQLVEPVFDYIAYSRLDDGDKGPINSEEHLRYCASLPYTTLKADVQPTSDGGLVLCHDKGFTFSDGRIVTYDKNDSTPINSLTTAQCLSLEYNKQYEGKYCIINTFHFRVSDTQTGWTTMEQSADGIAYAKAKSVKLYQAQVAQGVDVKKLIDAGYSGAQLRYVPAFTEHTKG